MLLSDDLSCAVSSSRHLRVYRGLPCLHLPHEAVSLCRVTRPSKTRPKLRGYTPADRKTPALLASKREREECGPTVVTRQIASSVLVVVFFFSAVHDIHSCQAVFYLVARTSAHTSPCVSPWLYDVASCSSHKEERRSSPNLVSPSEHLPSVLPLLLAWPPSTSSLPRLHVDEESSLQSSPPSGSRV